MGYLAIEIVRKQMQATGRSIAASGCSFEYNLGFAKIPN